jgi:hypothetical protein
MLGARRGGERQLGGHSARWGGTDGAPVVTPGRGAAGHISATAGPGSEKGHSRPLGSHNGHSRTEAANAASGLLDSLAAGADVLPCSAAGTIKVNDLMSRLNQ